MMSATQTPQSTCVDMEVPDIATPRWSVMSPVPNIHEHPHSHASPLHINPTLSRNVHSGGQVQFVSPPVDSTPLQRVTGDSVSFPMQLCTSPEISSAFSINQQELQLPRALPTPAKEMQHLTTQLQGNWKTLMHAIKTQEEAIHKLTHDLKAASTHHTDQATNMATKIQENQQQVLTLLATHKTQEEAETDQLTKAINIMLASEVKKVESTIVSEMRFMVNQLQAEVQQDLKMMQQNLQKGHEQLTTEIQKCNHQTVDLCAEFKKFQTEVTDLCKTQESKLLSMFKEDKQTTPVTLPATTPTTPLQHLYMLLLQL